jgi:CRISPR-associated endonuclease/helicase Cas3
MQLEKFYRSITGFAPYKYQLKIAELLLSGKNVILSVPTGAGKTWASVMPFLYAKQNGRTDFPQKMIYSLPLRTLTNSIYSDVSNVLEENEVFKNITSIHTGEYKNDEHFENDIIFSTIDQTLSNFLCFPLSLSKRQANINAGSLVGSYLVFDEFHLLDPKLSMSTTLGMLRILKNLCRFCIMTATLSDKYIDELKTAVNAEVVSINDFPDDALRIKSLKIPEGYVAKKNVLIQDGTINAQNILELHKKKTIVICNRVEKAQQLYIDIITSNLSVSNKLNIVCLHSRFFDEDREQKEKRLKQLFGKENNESAILISTQVIEAGMDISCDTMHVEISPVNSFLQRVGRCARWEGEHGNIYVYDVLELEEREQLKLETDNKEELGQIRAINNKYLPYDKALSEATLNELQKVPSLDENISQNLVDAILTSHEAEDYERIVQSDYNRSKILESWDTCEKNMYSQTIRDIQSIEIAIIDYEKERNTAFIPYKHQTIGLYKWWFIKWAKEIFMERNFDLDDDVVFIAEKNSESQLIDFDTNDLDSYLLKPVRDIAPLKNCYDIVFVDKSIFKYTVGAGLEVGVGSACSPLKPYEKKGKEIIEYKKDTFWQHNKAIIGCYDQVFKPNMNFTLKQLNIYWGEDIDWDKLIKTMICLHDYGKLNNAWQKPMQELQKLKGNYNPNEVLAHSDFNELTDKEIELQSGAKNKPPHAGVGAFAFMESAEDLIDGTDYEELANSVSTAILKHHGVETGTYPDFSISNDDYRQIETLLSELNLKVKLKQEKRGGNMTDYLPENTEEWIIYLFFVRI